VKFSIRKTVSWPTGPEVQQKPVPGGAMLYDASRAGNAEANWFDRGWWAQRGRVQPALEGRGAALFIHADGRRFVLRHYRRGGWMARARADRYTWHDADSTRSFAEWYLLYVMRRVALPVPVPIAACYQRVGRSRNSYTADLLTEEIPDVTSLATRIQMAPLPLVEWVAIGRCLRRFHEDGVCHADLNAHNILLGEAVWLIDFDRAALRRPGMWCDTNLVRLRRSLEKLTEGLPAEHFSDADWSSLLNAYFAAPASAAA
jgi:3-deoxy-D-manno-octulosonic acid kinase